MYMPAKIHLGAFMYEYVHKYCDVYGCVCVCEDSHCTCIFNCAPVSVVALLDYCCGGRQALALTACNSNYVHAYKYAYKFVFIQRCS